MAMRCDDLASVQDGAAPAQFKNKIILLKKSGSIFLE